MIMASAAKGGAAPTTIPNTKHQAAFILVHMETPAQSGFVQAIADVDLAIDRAIDLAAERQ
jgi:hypothetical protein